MKIFLFLIIAFALGAGAYHVASRYLDRGIDEVIVPVEEAANPAAGTDEATSDLVDVGEVESTEAGTASGTIGYPSEVIPALEIHAFRKEDDAYVMIKTNANQSTFEFDNLPIGTYTFVAYPAGEGGDLAGGYTEAVACGLSVDCTDHSLIEVEITAGDEATGIEIKDWYAPAGSFPEKPATSI